MEATCPTGSVSSPTRLAAAAANGKTTTPVRAKSPPATTLDPLHTTNGKANSSNNNNIKQRKSCEPGGKCELHDIADCEWCALGVKNRSMYGRLWPYAEHPVTREHYCLEPVESPTGGKFPCCSFRREKPIKTSQGYAGHLASHRAHIQGSTNTINGVGVVALPALLVTSNGGSGGGSAASPPSNGDQALGKKRKRESTLTGSHETVTRPTMSTTVATTSSSGGGGGGKVMPQFVASLQPSLPRCDLEAGQLRFILLPQDSEAAAIDVIFKGHRGKLNKRAAKDADGFFVIACPLIHELLPPNDTRTTFEVSVRVEDPATHRRLFQSSLLFTHYHAAAQASAAPRAESAVSAPRPSARASANEEEDYDEAEEGEEEKEEEMMTNMGMVDIKEEEGGDSEPAGEEEQTMNEDENTKKEKRRKIEEKSGGEEVQKEKQEDKMERDEASESQAMELEIAEENEDEESNDAEANVKKNEGEANGEDQKERRRLEEATPQKNKEEADDKKAATQQSAELQPDVTVKIEKVGETTADPQVGHQQQRELPDLLTQLAEVAAAESHSNVAPAAVARPAPSPGKVNVAERPTMAEALHAMPMNTISSLLPWAHMAAAAAGHPLPPHFALPDYTLTPAAAAAAAAAIAADPHTAALMLPGLFQSYYGPGGPLPLSALLPQMPHLTHLQLPPPARPLAPTPTSMMTSASSAMSISSSTSAMSPSLTAIKAKAPSSPPIMTSGGGGGPATATPPRSAVSTTPTTTMSATTTTAAKPQRAPILPMAQMMTSIPPPKPAKVVKPAPPPKPAKAAAKPPPPPQPPLAIQPSGSGPTTPPLAAGTTALTLASSAPLPTVAVAPESRPLQTLAAAAGRPSCVGAASAGRETCRYYFYTVLPEKGKLIWVVFFSSRRHSLEQYELLLHEVASPSASPLASLSPSSTSSSIERLTCSSGGGSLSLSLSSSASALAMAMATELDPDAGDSPSLSSALTPQPPSPSLPELPTSGGQGQQTIVLPAVPDLAWIAEGTDAQTSQRIYQHKVCFQAPDSTFERRIFCATLHQRVERTMTLLGGLSLVSTTSQREQMWARINQWFVGEVQQRLVHNCRHHPPSRRHFLNGKGSRQGSKQSQKDRFLFDELDKSVEIESVPVTSLLST